MPPQRIKVKGRLLGDLVIGSGGNTFFASKRVGDVWHESGLQGLNISETPTLLTGNRKLVESAESTQYFLCQPQQDTLSLHASSNATFEVPPECEYCQCGAEISRIDKAVFEQCSLDVVAPSVLVPWTLFSEKAVEVIRENRLTNFAFFEGFEGKSWTEEFIRYNYVAAGVDGVLEETRVYVPDWFQ